MRVLAVDGDISVVELPKGGGLIIDLSETGRLELRVYLTEDTQSPDGILSMEVSVE